MASKEKGMGVQTVVQSMKDMTPLAAAMLCGEAELIKVLIDAGATPNSHAFIMGAMMGPPPNLQAFLEHSPGFDVNQKGPMHMMCNTALHCVCQFGDASQQA